MDRAEQAGVGVALLGHVALFGLLSVGFLATPNPSKLISEPIDVAFVDEVGLKAAFPDPATEDPAESVAPELGPPEQMVTDAPIVEPAPAPEPSPAAAARPSPQAPSRPRLERPDVSPERDTRPAERQRGSRLGADFRKGLASIASDAKGQRPKAAVGAQAMTSLGAAIARQIRPCYNLGPLAGTAAMDIVVKVRLRPSRDGVVTRANFDIVGFTGVNASNSAYQGRVAEVARNAVLNPRCSPLKLPEELYEGGWEDIVLNFIPRQLG